MKARLLLLVLIVFFHKVQAQKNELLLKLSLEKNDTNKVNTLNQLAVSWQFENPDSTFKYAKLGLTLADSLKYEKGVFLHKLNLGHASWESGDYPSAIKIGYSLSEEKTKYAFYKYLLCNSYRDAGEPREALKWIDTVRDNYRITYASLASCYYGLTKYDSALYYLNRSIEHPAQATFEGWINLIFARTFEKLNNTNNARVFYIRSIQQLTQDKNYKDLSGALTSYSSFQLNGNELDSAIHFANQAYIIANQGKYQKEEYDAALILANIHEKKGNTQKALEFYKLAIHTKEKIYGKEKQKQIEGFKLTEELRKKDEAVTQEQQKVQTRIYALVITLLFFGLATLLLIINNRQKQKSKRKVEIAYERLKSTQSQLIQSEKMASLGELTAGIAHEIQNPLNFVNNFSEINNELIDELKAESAKPKADWDESLIKDTLDNLKDNEQKIVHHGKRADAIVKSMLQHSRTSSGKKEFTDINALCDEYLRLSYHGLRAKDKSFNAKFETHLDSTLPKLNVIPQDIGRVLLNLINNAFYAVSEKSKVESQKLDSGYEPTVTVSTKNLGDKIEVSVKDNGNGIPDSIKEKIFQPFFTTKPTGQGTGLGLSLSYDIVKAHGGELRVESSNSKCTSFIIRIPVLI